MADLKKQIDRIMYVSGYVISESPKYRPIIDETSFDSMPEGWNMKEAEAPAPEALADPAPAAPTSGATASPAAATPAPATPPPAPAPPATSEPAAPTSIAPELPKADVSPEVTTPFSSDGNQPPQGPPMGQDKDQLQRDLMKFQLDAMKKMSQKIDQLESFIDGLNTQQAKLYSEVEKVKDPSDAEKFAERKEDSSPYYFNLNDMWNDNVFQGKMDNFNSQGIIKTKDGYIADFDTLPKLNSYEVKNSFEAI